MRCFVEVVSGILWHVLVTFKCTEGDEQHPLPLTQALQRETLDGLYKMGRERVG